MNKTGISWTELTWNPVSGCSKVSPGCQNCYAEAWSRRWKRSFEVTLHPEKLKEVRKIPAGSKVFVNSMSDLFHDKVPREFILDIFKTIETRPDVIFQILTKRPENAGNWIIPENVWLGVSVELESFKKRIQQLHCIDPPSITKFISFEPLLGDIGKVEFPYDVKWIIIGGESGPHHRPMNIEWARNLIRQAKEQAVAVWMKQLGGMRPGGELEDFPNDLRIREFPQLEAPA